jgi:hypothetical protein
VKQAQKSDLDAEMKHIDQKFVSGTSLDLVESEHADRKK